MKTAYIITMHCPLNYGAILQTYALQTYLESLKLKVEVIDYRPEYVVSDQSLMYVGGEPYNKNILTRWAYRFLKAPFKIVRRREFRQFAKNELHLTPEYRTYEEIQKANLDADFFFCGSDQIWNVVSGAHKDPAYFLAFAPEERRTISYAASGNLPITDEVKSITFPMINKIDCISMREDSTINSIQPFIGKHIAHVCDPVFLLRGDEWRRLYKKYSSLRAKKRYVLVYPMGNGGDVTINQGRKLANQVNLPLYEISASQKKDVRIDRRFNVNPYDFLALIDNAEYIVTNSFHGTSFSIIFEKQFWTCVAEGANQRITSLLVKTGVVDRLLIGESEPSIVKRIDFESVKQNIQAYIYQSKCFIKKSINE